MRPSFPTSGGNPLATVRSLARTAFAGLLVLAAVLAAALGRPAAADEAMPHGQGLLWKIQPAGNVAPSYLFGTIHITDQRVLDLAPPVRSAFEQSQSAVFEVIMTDEVRLKLAQAMVLTDGRNLQTIVGPSLFAQATDTGARYGFKPAQLMFFRPWALAMMFSVPQEELARSAAGELPLDQYLQMEAARQGKSLHALESADQQIALFAGLSEQEQVEMLRYAVEENRTIESLFDDMTRRYLAGDIGGIHAQMAEQAEGMDQQFVESFLMRVNNERNVKMVERMTAFIERGGAFIAVGALHLPGEQGLVSLLAERGYEVERAY